MRFPTPINPYTIAPASARRVSVTFTADRCGDGWAVSRSITWKDREGDWDGEIETIKSGLSEAEARALAAWLTDGDCVAERAAGQRRAA